MDLVRESRDTQSLAGVDGVSALVDRFSYKDISWLHIGHEREAFRGDLGDEG